MRKLLVFASTFPRWENDSKSPFVYELSKRLTKDFDVHVLAPSFPGAKDFEIMEGMKVHRFHYFFKRYEKLADSSGILATLKKNKWFYFQVPFFLLAEYFALKKLVKEINPDVIHAHWIIPQGFISALVKKTTGVDYVVTSHGSDLMGLKGFRGIKNYTMKNAKATTVVSNALKDEVLKLNRNLEVDVIPMGVDTNLFNPKKKDLSIKRKHKINGPFLLFVGRLAPEKGINFVIEAMPNVLDKYPKTKLMIIGEGTMKEELKNRVEELKISDSVIFKGWVDNKDLPKYYATADLFVCPSLREGSPVSYIESLACGTPIVVGDIPISKEIVKNFGGSLVKNNEKDVSEKIIFTLSREISKNESRLNAVSKKYGWSNVSKEFEEVLK